MIHRKDSNLWGSTMARFEWLETFELGVEEIDNDHIEMLSIMKEIETSADAEDFDLTTGLLDKLVSSSMAHFEREEALLERHGYLNLDVHKEYHAALIARASAVKDVCKGIRSRENFKECCDEMFRFLIDDIVAGDLNFKSFLEEKGLIQRPK